jgi:cyclase
MLRPRIIPALLLDGEGLVKTIEFKDPRYIGDPLNAVKLFNEKEADELVILDINASIHKNEPKYELIEKIANECRMPMSYGGGIKTFDQASKIFKFGVEKIIVSSLFFENLIQINKMAKVFGNQSVVICLDVKKSKFSFEYGVYFNRGKNKAKYSLIECIQLAQESGAGEIIFNFIDRDGRMEGIDHETILSWKKICKVPITILGGIGSLDDIQKAISKLGIIGIACGSLFVYKGKHKAVLINYPNQETKEKLFLDC